MTRTSRLNVLERWIVAPFGQYLHYEHHVFPSIPNYNLPDVHRLLLRGGHPGADEPELLRIRVPEDPGRSGGQARPSGSGA